MPTFDSTVGGAAATSLATEQFATDYFAIAPNGAWWALLTSPERQTKLMQGTQRLEQESYVGQPATTTQALQWPRKGCRDRNGVDIASTVIPRDVGNALCEVMAQYERLESAGTDAREASALAQFSSVTAGDVSIDLAGSDSAPVTDELPTAARRWIGYLLRSSGMFGRVVR